MYLAYDKNIGVVHFSFCNAIDSSLVRGISIHNIDNKFTINKDGFLVVISTQFLNSCQYNDIRFFIKYAFIKGVFNLCTNIFYLIFYISKTSLYKYILFLLRKLYIPLLSLFFILNYFDFGFYQREISFQKHKKILNKNSIPWEKYFLNSNISKNVSNKKHSFIYDYLPNIKGIIDFRALPLTTLKNKILPYSGFIAIPYSKVISVRANDSILREPTYICQSKSNESFYVYRLNEKDKILLFDTRYIELKKNKVNYVIFSKNEMKKFSEKMTDICSYIEIHTGDYF